MSLELKLSVLAHSNVLLANILPIYISNVRLWAIQLATLRLS